MTTERIDVRASLRMVMQHVVICGPDDKVEKAIRDVDAAVAELIEADREYDEAWRSMSGRTHSAERRERAGLRRAAALSLVGGA